ncbi:MAG: hypothetical protein DWQ36_02430 [Acidobacteria bacterium]|nr:MAG: hypothetical protein DWQ30_23820 [Acidobacteriota bacterium]REK11299.1 MAG: hypothetical protein DWQ36_02430 [Acidobacteriota bacterium]
MDPPGPRRTHPARSVDWAEIVLDEETLRPVVAIATPGGWQIACSDWQQARDLLERSGYRPETVRGHQPERWSRVREPLTCREELELIRGSVGIGRDD